MTEIWVPLIPILLADVVNPVLFAFLVHAAGSKRPIANSSAVLLGHTVAYFMAGVLLALGLERMTARLANPQQIDFIIGFVVGALLLWVAFGSGKNAATQAPGEGENLNPAKAFGIGAIVNFLGIPFALPYFAALDQLLKANLTVAESLIVLVGYNVLYALPFAAVPVLVATVGGSSRPLLQRINHGLDRVSSYLMPVLLSLVGVALVADAISYFATGSGLF